GFRRKPNGRRLAEGAWRTRNTRGAMNPPRQSLTFQATGQAPNSSVNGKQTATACSIWVTTCTNGAPTGMRTIITLRLLSGIPQDPKPEHVASRAADRGGIKSKHLVPHIEAACRRRTRTPITDSAL